LAKVFLDKSFLNTFLTPTAHLLISRFAGIASLCGHERTQFDSTGKWNGAGGVLKTSRSSQAKPARWNSPDAANLVNVLRLVL
jgi:hypothetical protein